VIAAAKPPFLAISAATASGVSFRRPDNDFPTIGREGLRTVNPTAATGYPGHAFPVL